MSSQKPIEKFITRSLALLKRDFIIVGKNRVPTAIAWPIIAFLAGVTLTLAFLSSRSGALQEGYALEKPNSLTVLVPDGGEIWEKGSKQTIQWTSTGNIPPDYDQIRLFLNRYGLNGNKTRYDLPRTVNDGVEEITIPCKVPTGNYRLEVRASQLKGLPNTVRDESAQTFQITVGQGETDYCDEGGDDGDGGTPTDQSINVTYPEGGETFFTGQTMAVEWDSKGIPADANMDIFVESADKGPRAGKLFFVERHTPNDGSEEILLPFKRGIVAGSYKIGVRTKYGPGVTRGVSNTIRIAVGSGGGGVFVPEIPQFSCYDVRDGQSILIHPQTGQITNHVQRRKMASLRHMDCFWRAFSWAQGVTSGAPESLKPQIDESMRLARLWQARAMFRYFIDSRKALEKGGKHILGPADYSWIYMPNAFQKLREAIAYYPEGVAANPDATILQFIGAAYENGQVLTKQVPPTPKAVSFKEPKGYTEIGITHEGMAFDPLTDVQLGLMDQLDSLHAAAVSAIIGKRHEERVQIATQYDAITAALVATARSADEQLLLTLPPFTRKVCFDRPDDELARIANETNEIHHSWAMAVKEGRIEGPDGAWQTGLMHGRNHIILSNCTIPVESMPDFTWEREFGTADFK